MNVIIAHGLGGRSDLPVPLWLAVYGAAAAVLVSFFALGAFWRDPRFEVGRESRLLPSSAQRIPLGSVVGAVLRAVGLILYLAMLVVAAFGPQDPATNLAPTWVYVWLWVGLVPASLLFGPVWRTLNPLRTISQAIGRILRRSDYRAYPAGLGYWPAAASLSVFVWLELVYDRASEPLTVLAFTLVYSVVHVTGGAIYGPRWHERADGFEVYSTLIAQLSVVERRDDGRIAVRTPFRGLSALTAEPGLEAVVVVLLGSTAFDGLTRTQFWGSLTEAGTGAAYLATGTLGLACAVGFIAGTYAGAVEYSRRFLRSDLTASDPRGKFLHSLLPIAVGYTVAHYFSLFVFQGQAGYILASDPFARGWNIFGTGDWSINYLAISTQVIALVQVAAIVVGHVLGVIAAHDRAMSVFAPRFKSVGQYPLLAVMVIYTVGGITLLVGT